MYKLKEIISVDKKFQRSVNLRMDYRQEEKVGHYIPTKASVFVLKELLQAFIQKKGLRSSILIGPYGKGKSHLLLVLLTLLARKNRDKTVLHNQCALLQAVERIKKADEQAGKWAEQIIEEKKGYLPIIVSGAQNDLNRTFLLALKEALERDGLEELAPHTYFEEAKKMIFLWKEQYPGTYDCFLQCLQSREKKEKMFLKELENYEEEAYLLFKEIYPELTAGGTFEPMVQMDLITLYRSVNESLCMKHGYAGMVVIFDEFSKFVEGYDRERFPAAMEELQNICELANSSKEQEIHIILVAHKAMKEYANALPKSMINAYLGVEGRLREVYFTTSLKNNYELIQYALQKETDKFEKFLEEKKDFYSVAKQSYEWTYFRNLFREREYMDIVAKGCFPLTPVAAYLLLKVSEIAVQNERTVFTFLAGNERHSLGYFLDNCTNREGYYVTPGQVYDYFYHVFKNDTITINIHKEWLKAEYALSKATTEVESEIIKTLALINMFGKQDDLFPNDAVISCALGLSQDIYENAMEALIEKQLILFRSKTKTYAFKNNIGVDLEKEILNIVQNKMQKITLCKEIESISELEYELPKRYNQEFTMTRYFQYTFLTVKNFLQLTNTEYLFEEKFSDGKIIALMKDQEYEPEQIRQHLEILNDRRIVVLYPDEIFNCEEEIKKILAIRQLKANTELLEQNQAIGQELDLCEEDLLFEVNVRLEQYFLPFYGKSTVLYNGKIYPKERFLQKKSSSKFNQMLSQILAQYYAHAPRINNEMINKRTLTSQIKKARIKIIENILGSADFTDYQKGTSPEATIFRAVFVHTGILNVKDKASQNTEPCDAGVHKIMQEIQHFIYSAKEKKQSFLTLYEALQGEGFGVRKGVLPLYLAYGIAIWGDMPVFYLKDKEVALTPDILENINETPKQYSLYMEKETIEKENYLGRLEALFVEESVIPAISTKENRCMKICDAMYRWFCSLPQCSRMYAGVGKSEEQIKGMKTFRKEFSKLERNPREILFEKLPKAYGDCGLEKTYTEIELFKAESDEYVYQLRKKIAGKTKEVLGYSHGEDLLQCLKHWKKENLGKAQRQVFRAKTQQFVNCVEKMDSHDEQELVTYLSKSVLDFFVEDWKEHSMEQYVEALLKIIAEIHINNSKIQQENQQKLIFTNSEGIKVEKYFSVEEQDGTSLFLQNEIESTMEEFGDSLETNQKISVMLRMIEKLLAGQEG